MSHETIFAQCPECKRSMRVVVGRKSTCRDVRCECGARYSYSAWRLGTPDTSRETVDLRTFYKVEIQQETK